MFTPGRRSSAERTLTRISDLLEFATGLDRLFAIPNASTGTAIDAQLSVFWLLKQHAESVFLGEAIVGGRLLIRNTWCAFPKRKLIKLNGFAELIFNSANFKLALPREMAGELQRVFSGADARRGECLSVSSGRENVPRHSGAETLRQRAQQQSDTIAAMSTEPRSTSNTYTQGI